MIDTCAEGDGEQNEINIKRLLQYFKSYGTFSKYAIEMFTCIAQREVLLSKEMSARLQWGRFVHWVGGKRRNHRNIRSRMRALSCDRCPK